MANYWQDKRIVVTGGCGMVGSWLTDFLVQAGAHVTVMDTGVRGHNYNVYARYIPCDEADCSFVDNCVDVFDEQDIVFNLVAHVGGLYYNVGHHAEQFWGNVQLQCAPVLAAVEAKVPVFLQVSTVCCYSQDYNNPAMEEFGQLREPERSNAGYAWAKRMGERVAHWALEGKDTRYMIVRPTNCYGTRDYFDDKPHVIPALIKKFCSDMNPVPVYGGSQTREFIYDQDAARGMMVVAEKGKCGEVYNLGTSGDTCISIANLAEMIRDLAHSTAAIDYVHTEPTGDQHRRTNSSKVHALGWHHLVSLEEGLSHTIESYRDQCRNRG